MLGLSYEELLSEDLKDIFVLIAAMWPDTRLLSPEKVAWRVAAVCYGDRVDRFQLADDALKNLEQRSLIKFEPQRIMVHDLLVEVALKAASAGNASGLPKKFARWDSSCPQNEAQVVTSEEHLSIVGQSGSKGPVFKLESNLRSLSFQLPNLEVSLSAYSSRLQSCRLLILNGCSTWGKGTLRAFLGLRPILKGFPSLQYLDLRKVHFSTKGPVLKDLPVLQHLDLSLCHFSLAGPIFESLPLLRHLSLSECFFKATGPVLKALPCLEQLILNGCTFTKDLTVEGMQALQHLDLQGSLFCTTWPVIKDLPVLKHLRLTGIRLWKGFSWRRFLKMPSEMTLVLEDCPSLEELHMVRGKSAGHSVVPRKQRIWVGS
jgi:hypothetical protein